MSQSILHGTPPNRLAALLLGALLVFCTPIAADEVILNNGRTVTGRVRSQTTTSVVIESQGTRLEFPMTQVREVRIDQSGDTARTSLDEATNRLDANDPRGAWLILCTLLETDRRAIEREIPLAQRAVRALRDLGDESLRKEQHQDAEDIFRSLAEEPGASLIRLASAGDPATFERSRQRARATRLFAEGRTAANSRAYSQELEDSLREAMELLGEADPLYPQAAFLAAQSLVQRAYQLRESAPATAAPLFDEALRLLHIARDSRQADPTLAQQALSAIQTLRNQGIDYSASKVTPTPSPAPTAIPTATPVPPTPSPEPMATPELPPMERISRSLQGVFFGSADGQIQPFHKEYRTQLFIGGGIAIVWWLLPWIILKLMERNGNFHAGVRRGKVWLTGPFSIVLTLLDGRQGPSAKSKHSCPKCRGPLDNPHLWQDFNFSRCPHCGQAIRPVHDIVEHIRMMVDSLRLEAERADKGAISMDQFAKSQTMERLTMAIMTDAIHTRASDIHMEPAENGFRLRKRVDGMLTDFIILPKSMGPSIVSSIKARANMDVADRRRPQDGAFSFYVDGVKIDTRVATSPAANGEKASLRLLDVRSIQMDWKKLGMTSAQRECFERAISQPHGLVLITGPTGSGKTTTLYVALQRIRDQDKNIISIEDPIEFRIPGINQIQVNPASGLTFANGLRSVLRQDPDVIMVGEIRDKETADTSIEAASTGHLVFSTLHTIDSASAMARLFEFGITPRRFADSLNLIASQRLARLVCPDCRKMSRPTADELAVIGMRIEDIGDLQVPAAGQCDLCNKTGYYGRTGLFEMLLGTTTVREALERGNMTTVEIRNLAISDGMMTLREHGIAMMKRGLTTPEELLRVTR